jgi:hypothetical protein
MLEFMILIVCGNDLSSVYYSLYGQIVMDMIMTSMIIL